MKSGLLVCLVSSLAATLVGCGSDGSPATDAAVADTGRRNDSNASNDPTAGDAATDAGIPGPGVDWRSADAAPDVATPDGMTDGKPDGMTDGKPDGSSDGGFNAMPDLAAIDTTPSTADANRVDSITPSADGGCTGWTTLQRISPAEAVALMAKIDPIVINVHIPYEGDIPGTDTSIPYNDVDAIDAYLHQDHCAEILLVCKSGGMSKSAGDQLTKRGYLRVRDLAGGMVAWEAAGYPLLKDGGT
jgi:rhodanese-related sulfurtransferase